MKAIKFSILAVVMLATGITSVNAQTADEIMEKHAAAVGGADNWNKLKTLKMVGSMTTQGFELSYSQTIDVEKGIRIDISAMGMNGFVIMTKTGGYSYLPFTGSTKIDTMKADAANKGMDQYNVSSMQMLDYKTAYTKMEMAGKDSVNNVPCYKIKCTDKDNKESTSYFDASTYHLLRTERTVTVKEEEQEVATTFSNYQKQDGNIFVPMTLGTPQGDLNFKTIEVNKPIDASLFVPTKP